MNKLRRRLDVFTEKMALKIAGSCLAIDPNTITLASLIVLLIGLALLISTNSPLVFSVFIVISGLMDVLDGAIARAMGKASRKGAFLDSTVDKVNETIITIALLHLGFNPVEVLLFLAFSLLISYIRARAEALGLEISGVGLMERAERLIGVILILLIAGLSHEAASILFHVVLALTGLTVIQRMVFVLKRI